MNDYPKLDGHWWHTVSGGYHHRLVFALTGKIVGEVHVTANEAFATLGDESLGKYIDCHAAMNAVIAAAKRAEVGA